MTARPPGMEEIRPFYPSLTRPAPDPELARLRRIEAAAKAVIEEDDLGAEMWGGECSPAIKALREALRPCTP